MNPRRLRAGLLTCALVGATLAPPAALAQTPWYAGASAGQSAIDASSGEIEQGFLADDAFLASGTTLDKTDTGWKAYLGYRFNRFLAAEGGYADLGEASFTTTIVSAPAPFSALTPFPIHATATARGLFLSGLVHLPVTEALSLFAKAGAFRWEAKFTERIPGTDITRVSRSERKTDPYYGLGLQLQFTSVLGGRLEWERFKDVGQGIGGREGRDIDFISGGIVLQF